jgi:hypothetical protein
MVTRAELDRVANVIAHTDQKLDAVIQQATQDRVVLAQLMEQMQLHHEQLDLSFTQKFSELRQDLLNQSKPRSPSPDDGDRSNFILQTGKKPMDIGSGSKHQQDCNSGYRTDQYQPPRADCPGFSGDNVIE